MKKNKKYKIGIILSNLIFGLLFIPSLVMFVFSPMIFDAPGSTTSPFTILFWLSIFSFPFAVIISIVCSWILYNSKKYLSALLISLLPILNIILYFLSSLMMDYFCNGSFVC